jgi:hypothetical protein
MPPVPPLPAIFWGQKYIPVRPYALIFSVFLFFSFWIFSFRYFLLFLPSFSLFFSSYSSRRAILRLLILLLLYFKLFVVLQTCIIIIVHISVILRFLEGAKHFLSYYSSLLYYILPLLILLFL